MALMLNQHFKKSRILVPTKERTISLKVQENSPEISGILHDCFVSPLVTPVFICSILTLVCNGLQTVIEQEKNMPLAPKHKGILILHH